MSAEKKKQMGVLGLVVALVVVLAGSILFMGAASGWFDDPKVVLDAEYTCDEDKCDLNNLGVDEYEKLINERKSFVVFVDQGGCTTADRLREYVTNWANGNKIEVYRMMFEDVKKSSLHDAVKYYPSVVIVSHGKPVAWLRADSDEDAEAYNDSDAFTRWMAKYL